MWVLSREYAGKMLILSSTLLTFDEKKYDLVLLIYDLKIEARQTLSSKHRPLVMLCSSQQRKAQVHCIK